MYVPMERFTEQKDPFPMSEVRVKEMKSDFISFWFWAFLSTVKSPFPKLFISLYSASLYQGDTKNTSE